MIHLQRAESQQTCPCSALEAVCLPVPSAPPQSTVIVSGRRGEGGGGREGKLYPRNITCRSCFFFFHIHGKEWIGGITTEERVVIYI